MIVEQTYHMFRNKYNINVDDLVNTEVRIGLYLSAVRLSDGSVGICSTLVNDEPVCIKGKRILVI